MIIVKSGEWFEGGRFKRGKIVGELWNIVCT